MRFHLVVDIDTGKEPLGLNALHSTLATLAAVVRDSAEHERDAPWYSPAHGQRVSAVAPTAAHPVWHVTSDAAEQKRVKVGRWWVEESTDDTTPTHAILGDHGVSKVVAKVVDDLARPEAAVDEKKGEEP